MNNLSLLHEVAALAGYTIDATTGQDPTNKTRALRRVNAVKADIVSRYGGHWPSQYRESWLPLAALYNTGTITVTQNSTLVVGSGTVWTSDMKGRKIIIGSETYKIASVTDGTDLVLSQPYQQTSQSALGYNIWKDEYVLHPEVWAVGGFIDYKLPQRMEEAWNSNMKESFPLPASVEEPTVYTVLGRQLLGTPIIVGTVSALQNTNTWTGVGTTWLSGSTMMEPGMEFVVGSYTYHVRRVNSDTELETYQMSALAVAGSAYSAKAKNAVVVRFKKPTDQRIVHYWYYSKDYPFVNDNDEDWIAEMFPEVLMNGCVRKDYLDKNDVARASLSKQEYEDSIKNMRVAVDASYTGIRTLGIYVPPEARE